MIAMTGAMIICFIFSVLYPMKFSDNLTEAFKVSAAVGLLAFVVIHGTARYGWQRMSIFFAVTFIVSFTMESISIKTGFPFGNYYYTDALGIMLGDVPLKIMPAYFFTGYLAWTMSTTFLKEFGHGIRKKNVFLVPLIASFIMVMWDYCFDPVMSTIEKNWIWEIEGAFHGVPVSNYLGWFLTVYIIFQIFALLLYKFSEKNDIRQTKKYWGMIPVMFFIQAVPYLIFPLVNHSNEEIYWSSFLGAIFTMVFVSMLNMVIIRGYPKKYFNIE
ncbi:MAG: carotenoid biosynthesis protein [Clostridia bacterium]|nr:carotenoid biosynthesis protein [Clostridia bacterium]